MERIEITQEQRDKFSTIHSKITESNLTQCMICGEPMECDGEMLAKAEKEISSGAKAVMVCGTCFERTVNPSIWN